MARPRLADLVCNFLYRDQARIHIARTYGWLLCGQDSSNDTDEAIITCNSECTAGMGGCSQFRPDWYLFTDGELWLWRVSTEEWFYIEKQHTLEAILVYAKKLLLVAQRRIFSMALRAERCLIVAARHCSASGNVVEGRQNCKMPTRQQLH